MGSLMGRLLKWRRANMKYQVMTDNGYPGNVGYKQFVVAEFDNLEDAQIEAKHQSNKCYWTFCPTHWVKVINNPK
jgi:hypothetical protein